MKFPARFSLLLLLFCAPLVHAWDRPEMARYGAAYAGPELLRVYVAHTKADDYAVIKIHGINHPLDQHIYWAKVRYQEGYPERIYYAAKEKEGERVVFFVNGASATLKLPNYHGQALAELRLSYDGDESTRTAPEHLLTDYARQIGAIQ
ncbi:MAG: hypothetical protein LBO00_05020 [Zoogloeaceae bacterium]|jgi:hypothetical protein|nr:hypothetical protein [Zoogloeaceae bacterium]